MIVCDVCQDKPAFRITVPVSKQEFKKDESKKLVPTDRNLIVIEIDLCDKCITTYLKYISRVNKEFVNGIPIKSDKFILTEMFQNIGILTSVLGNKIRAISTIWVFDDDGKLLRAESV